MKEEEYFKKNYKSFQEFLHTVCSKDLEYFILDSKFTSAFNCRMKKLVEELKKDGKEDIEFGVIFNTEGETVLIDAEIIGEFVANNYISAIEKYYKNVSLDKIIKEITDGNEKVQSDFTLISCKVLYNLIEEVYKDIKYKKEIANRYIKKFNINTYKDEDLFIITIILLISEDICRYIGIKKNILENSIRNIQVNN